MRAPAAAPSAIPAALSSAVFPPRPPRFPPGPPADIAPAFLADPLATLDSLTARYGPLVGARLGGAAVVLVGDPGTARDVLVDRAGEAFGKAGTAFFPASSVTGDGLLTSDGESWRRQRQLAGPAFRKAAVEAYGGAMGAAAAGLTAPGGAWGGVGPAGSVRDVYADFNALTLRIVTDALFGGEAALGPGVGERVSASVNTAFTIFTRRALGASPLAALLPEWVPTPDNVALRSAVDDLDGVVYGIIRAARARAESGEVSFFSFLLALTLVARGGRVGACFRARVHFHAFSGCCTPGPCPEVMQKLALLHGMASGSKGKRYGGVGYGKKTRSKVKLRVKLRVCVHTCP